MNLQQAMELFVTSAIEHAEATENGDYRRGNAAYDQIVMAARYLRDTHNLKELAGILGHENTGVHLWAATYLLETMEDVAKKELLQITGKNLPHYSFDAEMVLQEWENGHLKLNYK